MPLERAALAGVRDVVPTFRSVAVYFDPLRTDRRRCSSALERDVARCRSAPRRRSGATVRDPGVLRRRVRARSRRRRAIRRLLARTRSIALHAARDVSRVHARVRPGLRVHRDRSTRGSPRRGGRRRALRVPAGSVGIAGAQTGIYPLRDAGRLAAHRPHAAQAVRSRPRPSRSCSSRRRGPVLPIDASSSTRS